MIKHIPERKCVSCGEHFPQKTMIKVTKSGDTFFIDEKGKANGRGAYVCKKRECIEIACAKKQFNRSFKCSVPEDIYTELTNLLKDMVD